MTTQQGSTDKARIIYPDGRIEEFTDQVTAYRCFLGLPRKWRAAFHGKRDARPVYPHDFIAGL